METVQSTYNGACAGNGASKRKLRLLAACTVRHAIPVRGAIVIGEAVKLAMQAERSFVASAGAEIVGGRRGGIPAPVAEAAAAALGRRKQRHAGVGQHAALSGGGAVVASDSEVTRFAPAFAPTILDAEVLLA